MQLSAYLFFDGTCEEALRFYEKAGLGRAVDLRRYENSPLAGKMPPEKIINARFEGRASACSPATQCSRAATAFPDSA